MEKPESEDEDGGVYQAKSLITCDSPSNLSVTRTKSRSRSRSHSRSRSNSSSSELEVDSPPPPRITMSPLIDIQHVRQPKSVESVKFQAHIFQTKKSEAFSVSALLRDDQPKTKSPASSNNSFENIRFVCRLLNWNWLITNQFPSIDHRIHKSMTRAFSRGLYFTPSHFLQCCRVNNSNKTHRYRGNLASDKVKIIRFICIFILL